MKKIFRTAVFVFMLTFLFSNPASAAENGEELLADSGFEAYSSGIISGGNGIWIPYYSSSVAFAEVITKTDFADGVYEGNQAIRFTNLNNGNSRGIRYSNNFICGKPGEIYEFTGYFRTDGEGVTINVSNNNQRFGTEIFKGYDDVLLTDKWQKITQRYIVAEENTQINLRVNTNLTTDKTTVSGGSKDIPFVYADSISFKKVGNLSVNDTAKLVYKKYFMETYSWPTSSDTATHLTTQLADGTWSDINYADNLTNRTATAMTHLTRLRGIARNMNRYDKQMYKDKATSVAALEKGIAAWKDKIGYPLREDGTLIHGTSWWNDTIGQQLNLIGPILILAEDELSDESKQILVDYLYDYQDMKNYPGFLTGANLVWYCQNGIIRGIAENDSELVMTNYKRMMQEWSVTEQSWEEGIQSDYSFHQHLQNFQPMYSINFVANSAKNFDLLTESGYISGGDYKLASDFMTEGMSWMFRGKYAWPMLLGREITEEAYVSNEYADVVAAAESIAGLDSETSAELKALASYIEYNKINTAYKEGNKYFHCSDFIVHQRPEWGAAVRMMSNRTVASESSRTQNFWGQYSNAGEYAMTKSGDVQNDAFLYYDRTRLPGTTLPQTLEKSVYDGTFVSQADGFAGGVSDGTYGAATMQMSRWNIKANKSWFFFDDEYVCLGSGITSTRDDVATTVDTRIAKGDIKVDGAAVAEDKTADVTSVFTNEIGYYFPDGETLEIKKGTQSKSWGELNNSGDTTLQTADVFSLIIPHGDKVRNDKYAYIVMPSVSEAEFNTYIADCPVEIAENSDRVQAVAHKNGIYYASFIKAGECEFSDGVKISADKNALVLLRKNSDGTYSASVSTAHKKVKVVNITITIGGKTTVHSFDMPQNTPYDEMLGSTVTKTI